MTGPDFKALLVEVFGPRRTMYHAARAFGRSQRGIETMCAEPPEGSDRKPRTVPRVYLLAVEEVRRRRVLWNYRVAVETLQTEALTMTKPSELEPAPTAIAARHEP